MDSTQLSNIFYNHDKELERIDFIQERINETKQNLLKTINILENTSLLKYDNCLHRDDIAKQQNKCCYVSLINLIYTKENTMNRFTILTPDCYTTSVIIPAINNIMSRERNDDLFEIKESTIDHMPQNVDFRFLHFKNPLDDYIEETLLETELNLYASPEYLERYGEPKKLSDLNAHKIIKLGRGNVLETVGKKYYVPIGYKEDKKCIKVDSLSSLFSMGEQGCGIICVADKNIEIQKLKLEKINKLENTYKIPLVFSTHKKIKHHPIVKELMLAVRTNVT